MDPFLPAFRLISPSFCPVDTLNFPMYNGFIHKIKGGIPMKVLFLGNSHTFYNDMPQIFADICKERGKDVEVAMQAPPASPTAGTTSSSPNCALPSSTAALTTW